MFISDSAGSGMNHVTFPCSYCDVIFSETGCATIAVTLMVTMWQHNSHRPLLLLLLLMMMMIIIAFNWTVIESVSKPQQGLNRNRNVTTQNSENVYLTRIKAFSPSHLSASTLRSVPARIMTCQCLRSSAISVVIWFLAISSFTRSRFGLPRFLFPSTSICNIFLVASSLSLLCTCPNHLNLFSLRNSAIGYMCASFQMSTFLTWSSLVFPLAHRSMRISVVCNFLSSFFLTAQHSAPYTMAGFIAVLYTLSFNFVGTFLSHITPVVSLHFDQAIFTLLFTSFSTSWC